MAEFAGVAGVAELAELAKGAEMAEMALTAEAAEVVLFVQPTVLLLHAAVENPLWRHVTVGGRMTW